jgi:hypothetical protein
MSLPPAEFICKIDWERLRDQKSCLLGVIDCYESLNPRIAFRLEGLLNLIDALQDYAVDVLGVNSDIVYLKGEDE